MASGLPLSRAPSTLSLARGLLAAEGWAGLFRGVAARVAKVAPSCAIMISCYELGKVALHGDGALGGLDVDEAAVLCGEQ